MFLQIFYVYIGCLLYKKRVYVHSPNGRINNMDTEINQAQDNYFRYILKSNRLSCNPLVDTVQTLEFREETEREGNSKWCEIDDKHILYLFPELFHLTTLSMEQIITLCGGKYIFSLAQRYIHHNREGANLTLLVHESQFDLDEFYEATQLNNLRIEKHGDNLSLLTKYRAKQKRINQKARRKNVDKFAVLKVIGVVSRHGRDRKKKTKRKYSVYIMMIMKRKVIYIYIFPLYFVINIFFVYSNGKY